MLQALPGTDWQTRDLISDREMQEGQALRASISPDEWNDLVWWLRLTRAYEKHLRDDDTTQ